jgi:hypothetical protein
LSKIIGDKKMKKILFLACIFTNSLVFSQTREYEDRYLLTEPFCESCFFTNDNNSPLNLDILNDSRITQTYTFLESYYNKNFTYLIEDVAQRYETDESIQIDGVAALFQYIDYGSMHGYLCIADDSLNILRKVKLESCYDTTNGNIVVKNVSDHYIELFFDSSVSVNGEFYAVVDNPKPYPFFPNEYNWGGGADINYRASYMTYLYSSTCFYSTNVALSRSLLFRGDDIDNCSLDSLNSSDWEQMSDLVLYLFPILADTTIVDTTDSSSLVNIVDNYTFIFPNPTSKEVNVQCSFRMQALELFNEQGQKVNEWKIDSYHYLLNVEDYPKGNYILKIKTKSGTTTKKVIVQ